MIFGSHSAASIEFCFPSAPPRLRLENLLIISWFSALFGDDPRVWRRVDHIQRCFDQLSRLCLLGADIDHGQCQSANLDEHRRRVLNDTLKISEEAVMAQDSGQLILLISEFEHDASKQLSIGAHMLDNPIPSIDWNLQSKIPEVPPLLGQSFPLETEHDLFGRFFARDAPMSVL
jgi:hypothetical protein